VRLEAGDVLTIFDEPESQGIHKIDDRAIVRKADLRSFTQWKVAISAIHRLDDRVEVVGLGDRRDFGI